MFDCGADDVGWELSIAPVLNWLFARSPRSPRAMSPHTSMPDMLIARPYVRPPEGSDLAGVASGGAAAVSGGLCSTLDTTPPVERPARPNAPD